MKCHYRHVPVEAFPPGLREAVGTDRELEEAIHESLSRHADPRQSEVVLSLAQAAFLAWNDVVPFGETFAEFLRRSFDLADLPAHCRRAGLDINVAVEPQST